VSRGPGRRLVDIREAIAAIRDYTRAAALTDGRTFDAVRMQLLVIGEAVKNIPAALTATEPDVPWRQIIRFRDLVSHRYFDTLHSEIEYTVTHDLNPLDEAVIRIQARLEAENETGLGPGV
jgi:uncharacterized protein with HEPN domain